MLNNSKSVNVRISASKATYLCQIRVGQCVIIVKIIYPECIFNFDTLGSIITEDWHHIKKVFKCHVTAAICGEHFTHSITKRVHLQNSCLVIKWTTQLTNKTYIQVTRIHIFWHQQMQNCQFNCSANKKSYIVLLYKIFYLIT